MIPVSIHGILDIVALGNKYRLEKLMTNKNKKKDYFRVVNPSILSNLGQLDYIFMDKIF